jgi:hypothetical protein
MNIVVDRQMFPNIFKFNGNPWCASQVVLCLRRTERQVQGRRELGSRSVSLRRAFVCAQVRVDAPNLETEDVIRCCLLRTTEETGKEAPAAMPLGAPRFAHGVARHRTRYLAVRRNIMARAVQCFVGLEVVTMKRYSAV